MVAIDGLLETMSHILDKMLPYQQKSLYKCVFRQSRLMYTFSATVIFEAYLFIPSQFVTQYCSLQQVT